MKYQDTDFLYASGRIKALELMLIDNKLTEKLINANDEEEMRKILVDTGYLYEDSIDKMLVSAGKITRDLIFSLVSEKKLVAFLLYPYDYHNIKAILKSEITGDGIEDILSSAGFFDKAFMQRAVLERNLDGLTENMQSGIKEALGVYSKTQDVRDIDIALAGFCFADMLKSAELSNDEFVLNFIKLQIDLTNIKNLIRLKKADAKKELAAKVFIPNGDIPRDRYLDNFMQDIDVIKNDFTAFNLYELLNEGIKTSAADLDKLSNNYLLSYLSKAKYVGYGFSVVTNFMFAKENERKTIRIIAASKSAGLSEDEIRQLIF